MNNTPVFIIIGQSNEGKSSIVSTLVGHDRVKVDHDAGTTTQYRVFPIEIDGKKIMDFIDTPGFEHPKKILKWLHKNENNYPSSKELFRAFYDIHNSKESLKHDCQLIFPIKDHDEACILYVFDGARPIDQQDLWAMEIVGKSGCSRIALINCRDNNMEYLDKWKNECKKYFSSVKEFNAHTATFKDRIKLLDNMGALVEELYDPLKLVTENLQKQRDNLYELVCENIEIGLRKCMQYRVEKSTHGDMELLKREVIIDYKKGIENIEKSYRETIRNLYRHEIFDVKIPKKSVINEDLFSEETWSILGLNKNQLTSAIAVIGGVVGALLALPTGGLSVISGAALGAAAAGGTFLYKGEDMFDVHMGKRQHITVGPNTKPQFYYILLDRMMLYYSYMVNRAHGKRIETKVSIDDGEKQGFTAKWGEEQQKEFQRWLNNAMRHKTHDKSLPEILAPMLKEIDNSFGL